MLTGSPLQLQYMLMANMAVAGKIAAGLPEQALLRRHEPPIDRRLVSCEVSCNPYGMSVLTVSLSGRMLS